MNNIWERYSWIWTNLLWVIAGIIVLIDPAKIYEWGHRHEGWGDLIVIVFGILLSWAAKQRSQEAGHPGPLKPPQKGQYS